VHDGVGLRQSCSCIGVRLADVGDELLATALRQPIDPDHPVSALAQVLDELATDESARPCDDDHRTDARRARASK